MLRKTLLVALATTLTAAYLTLFPFKGNKKNIDQPSEMALAEPGWFKDYAILKGLDQIDIPFNLQYTWYQADQRNARFKQKGFNSLENIKEVGPSNVGGRTRSIVIDYSNQSHLLAGSVSGGLWYSYDNGNTWTPTDDQGLSLAVTAITQSPFDPSIIYYGTGETYNNTINQTGQGLFKSEDGGNSSFHLVNSMTQPMSEIWDVEHSLSFDSTLYIGTHNGGLWRTTDGGNSYTKIFSTGSPIHEVHAFADSTLMFSVSGGGIFKLDEESLTATKLANGLPTSNFSRISFNYCKASPNVIYAQILTSNFVDIRGTYKSINGGDSWTQLTNPTNVGFTQGWYDFKLGVSNTDPDFIVSLGIYGAYSSNGGQSWNNLGASHVDYHEVQFYAGGQQFLVGNDGGVYRHSMSNLKTSVDLNQTYNVTQFYAGYYHPSKADVIAGAQDNNTRYSTNGASYFQDVLGGDGSFCAISQQDPNVIYMSSQYLNLYKSVSGSYSDINNYIYSQIISQSNTWFINPFEINPLDGDQIYVPTKKQIFRSLNQGNSWASLTADLPGSSYSIGISSDEDPVIYIGGTGSILHRLDQAASNELTEVPLYTLSPVDFRGSTISCIEVVPNDEGTIYCALSNISSKGRIWRITDADTDQPSWENLHANLPTNLGVNWVEVDPDNPDFIMIATDYGLYSSTNGGGWWEKETRIPNVTITQIRLRNSDRKLYIFTHGRGAWTADLIASPTASAASLKQDGISIYPNPASDLVQIKAKEFQNYSLFNAEGKQVRQGVDAFVDVKMLKAGIYYLEVNTAQGRVVKKLIVSK